MQHPDFTSQLARERRARYPADAGRSRLARPDRGADARVSSSGRTDGERD